MPGSDQRIAGLKIGLLGRFRGQRLSRWVRLSRLGCPRDVPNRRDTRRQLQQLWATLLTTERTGLRPQLLQRRDDHHTRRRAKEAKIVPYIFAKTRHESALPQEREKARHVDEPFPRYTHRLGAGVPDRDVAIGIAYPPSRPHQGRPNPHGTQAGAHPARPINRPAFRGCR